MNKGNLIIISGPSGVGKSTIRKRLVEENDNFWYSISMTTRKPRIDEKTGLLEKNGDEYFFTSLDEFKENIENNNFLEYTEVYKDTYYGTLKSTVIEKLNKGINVILEIDVDGALKIKQNYNEAILIFIKPKTMEELENRLRNRKSDNEEKIIERLNKAIYEIEKSIYYDYVIESTTRDEDYEKILNIVLKKVEN